MHIPQGIKDDRTQRFAGPDKAPRRGAVVTYAPDDTGGPNNHERVTRGLVAEKLAAILGYEFGGEHEAGADYGSRHLFFVPGNTVVGVDNARALGINGERDLFGGVVPHAFVATKSITHGLVPDAAHAPVGWSAEFADDVRDVVLRGYSAFSLEDARRAGQLLLERGSVRVKPGIAIGGRGQTVVTDAESLGAALDAIDPAGLRVYGVALEENLADVVTYSVGHVVVGDLEATYFGTQKLTREHAGAEVYGGSDLTVARGDFDALLALALPAEAREAIASARTYDAAAGRRFGGFIASRRNYDVAVGSRGGGAASRTGGVLEQSWRVGGASGAEVAALQWFRDQPHAHAVHAECFECYDGARAPLDAVVYFDGEDATVGRILKYTRVEPYVDA